ncbi:MAG: replication initiator protein A [Candidatus Theseobacter exili]|nr:replication initiator protein A [Candidatus Theseobacter exili]
MQRYKINEIDQVQFYMVPKELFKNQKYKGLNSDARILYAILRDRMELSRSNGWVNEAGEIYLIYSREALSELISIGLKTVTKAVRLLKTLELIEEVRQGLGKPNIFYIGHIELESLDTSLTRKMCVSGNAENAHQKAQNVRPNDTEVINTDLKSQSVRKKGKESPEIDGQTNDINSILKNEAINNFIEPVQKIVLESVTDLYRNGVTGIPLPEVRERLKKINHDILTTALFKFDYANEEKHIINNFGYFRMCLFNAINENLITETFDSVSNPYHFFKEEH